MRETVFSPCRYYRYTLWRDWADMLTGERGYVQFICLNPSTADETKDDPTIRRCVQFAKDFGCSALCMTNLFAWRHTDPHAMLTAPHPIGPDNDMWIEKTALYAKIIIAAWGNDGIHMNRASQIQRMLGPKLQVLKINNATGQPAHPLYLKGTLRPVPWV